MRPSIDDYLMGFARQAARRATCPRKHVGAVIARDGLLLSTGYNGSIRGMPHCDDPSVGCLMEDGHCVRTVHAESNAILQAAKNGVRIDGATLYVTASPCWPCFSLVANTGIRRIFFGEAYRADDSGPRRVVETAAKIGIDLISVDGYLIEKPCPVPDRLSDEYLRARAACGCLFADCITHGAYHYPTDADFQRAQSVGRKASLNQRVYDTLKYAAHTSVNTAEIIGDDIDGECTEAREWAEDTHALAREFAEAVGCQQEEGS